MPQLDQATKRMTQRGKEGDNKQLVDMEVTEEGDEESLQAKLRQMIIEAARQTFACSP